MSLPPPRTDRPHALSVDVEDWFQVLNMQHLIARDDWNEFELRCGRATERLLALFEERDARATFFFLGWIAERLPELVRAVHAAGHEIGSHGYDHRVLDDLGPDGFREDLAKTSAILGELTGEAPTSFRACTWSIKSNTLWAPTILVEEGYTLDSSVFPTRHPDYGIPTAPATPYVLATPAGELHEFPPLTWGVVGNKRLPVGGGGYLRLFPQWFMARGLAEAEANGWPGCVYLHPWEVDPDQPRPGLRGLRAFRHYVNLGRTESKLDALLRRFRFVGLREALAAVERPAGGDWPVVDLDALARTAR